MIYGVINPRSVNGKTVRIFSVCTVSVYHSFFLPRFHTALMGKLGIENFLLEIFFVLPLVFHRECFENARRCLCRLECIVVDTNDS